MRKFAIMELLKNNINDFPMPILDRTSLNSSDKVHLLAKSSICQADINRTALLIPALCGNIDERIVERAFYHANQRDLKDWEKENIPYAMRKKRQKCFRDTGSSQKLVNKAVS